MYYREYCAEKIRVFLRLLVLPSNPLSKLIIFSVKRAEKAENLYIFKRKRGILRWIVRGILSLHLACTTEQETLRPTIMTMVRAY